MRRLITTISVMIALGAFAVCALAQTRDPRSLGYVKPELREAMLITPQMLAPVRLNPQEQYFNVSVIDPRSGNFRYGYILHKFETDPAGNQVITVKSYEEHKYHDLTFQKSESLISETYNSATGRIIKAHIEGNTNFIASFWSIYCFDCYKSYAPPSSVTINRTAYFDWANRTVTIKHDEAPQAKPRSFPMQNEPLGLLSEIVFLLKGEWTELDRIYYLPHFNVHTEKHEDLYIKYSGARENGQLKYDTVWHGFGEAAVVNSYWVIPPGSSAFNGHFNKVLVNPQVWRYATITPTTKEEALKPIPPYAN